MLTAVIAVPTREEGEALARLADWEGCGFSVAGQFTNGVDAMEAIFDRWPDVVLADVDLPGLDAVALADHAREHGIFSDFVLLGDRGDFGVAQRAMRLGVEEYLLRPVSREELTRVLQKYAQRRHALDSRDMNEHFLQTRRLLRNTFMDRLTQAGPGDVFTLEELNGRYHFMLRPGTFQSVILAFHGLPKTEAGIFLPAIVQSVRARFDPICHELIPFVQGADRVAFTLNYGADSAMAARLGELETIVQEHLRKRGCGRAAYVIGVGLPEGDVKDLRRTLDTAEKAVFCGMLRGWDRLYDYGALRFDRLTGVDLLATTQMGELKAAVSALDGDGFRRALRGVFSPVTDRTDPGVVIAVCRAAADMVEEVCPARPGEARDPLPALGCCPGLEDLVRALSQWAGERFQRARKEREHIRPVRDAMAFIRQNCTQPLTLERVSEEVHLNASYFSAVFKKETGRNFSEYLTACRVEEAKRLLTTTGMSVSQICAAVGYTDNKHFSRMFTRLVGVRPSAYRTLHG